MVSRVKLLLAVFAFGCVVSRVCYGQDTGANDLNACAVLDNDKSRLECYDSLRQHAAVPQQALPMQAPSQITTVAPAVVSASPPSIHADFGKETIPNKSKTEGKATLPTNDTMSAHVKTVIRKPTGLVTIELDNGQVWSETSRTGGLPPKAGDEITVKRALFGGYFLAGTTGMVLRVQRLR
jgi:hypothetical protein